MFLLRLAKGIFCMQGARGGHDRQEMAHNFLRMVGINNYQRQPCLNKPF